MERYKRAFLLLFATVLFSCATTQAPVIMETPPVETGKIIPEPVIDNYLTLLAAGDNLYHDVMIQAGEEGDYETAYGMIRPLTEKADIAFINQETLLAGKGFGFSGYPLFNTPQKLGQAIAGAGFDVINHATNHIMDKGEKAVFATMDFWDTIPEARILGIHRSEEERALPFLIKKNNITLGFLSYTYGTNGIPVPKDKPYLVSLINTEIMKKEIAALRPLCDFLVVSMHWGEEYSHNYNKTQRDLAAFLAEQLVDLVIGHHPHVIQPIEYIERPDGKFMLCFYSLGNFLSAQARTATLLGAMAYVKIKGAGGGAEIEEAGAIPLVTHYEKDYKGMKVYPLYEYSGELADKHRRNQAEKVLTMEYLSETSSKIFGDKEIKQNPFTK